VANPTVYLWRNNTRLVGDVVCGPCQEAPTVRETYAGDDTREIDMSRDGIDGCKWQGERRIPVRRVTCAVCEGVVREVEAVPQ
jgi:hypothetical protein